MISQARLFLNDTSENQLRNMSGQDPGQDQDKKTYDRTGRSFVWSGPDLLQPEIRTVETLK